MEIEVKLDPTCRQPRVVIHTDRVTEQVSALVRRISEADMPAVLSGFRDGVLEVLEPDSILRIYSQSGKVLAETDQGTYILRLRLYEVEARLDPARFVRISHGELIQLRCVRHFDLSFTGTICVTLSNGTVTYVSRRYVSKVKQVLGL